MIPAILGTVARMGMRYGPQIYRGLGKALGFGRSIGKSLGKVRKIADTLKTPAKASVGLLFGADSKESQTFNKYADKADDVLGKAEGYVNQGIDAGQKVQDRMHRFKTKTNMNGTQGYV